MKKRVKKKAVKRKKTAKNNNSFKIIIGIIIITVLAIIIYLVFIKVRLFEEVVVNKEEPKINVRVSFEWKDPRTIRPYGGRFYEKCEDGTNIGKIWANIELLDQDPDLSFTCKATTIVKETRKIVDATQLNLGANRVRSGFIGFTEELAKDHLIEVCCKGKLGDHSLCDTFEFRAYC